MKMSIAGATAAACLVLSSIFTLAAAEELWNHEEPIPFHPNVVRQPILSPENNVHPNDWRRIKRQNTDANKEKPTATATEAVRKFQAFILDSKRQCAVKLGLAPNEVEKFLLLEQNPTPKQKCLIACVLERIKIMDDRNKVSVDTISRFASLISHGNALVVSIARATADNCNRYINVGDKCEAAAQINRCIAHGLKAHRIQLAY